jgi:flagellar hook-length control protein FliK
MPSKDRTAAQTHTTKLAADESATLKPATPEQEALQRSIDLFGRDSRPKVTIVEGNEAATAQKPTVQPAANLPHEASIDPVPEPAQPSPSREASVPLTNAPPAPTAAESPESVERPATTRYIIETPKPHRIPGQIRVRLQPPELGHVRIDLAATRSGIVGSLRFQSQQSRRVVETELGQLHKTLHDAGIRVERLEVTGTSFSDSRGSVHADTDSTPQWSHDSSRERPQGEPRPDHPSMPETPTFEHNAAFIGNTAAVANSVAFANAGSVDLMA